MKDNIFISIPVEYLEHEIRLIKKYKFNLELKIFSNHLDSLSLYDFIALYENIKSLNLRLSIHAPFIDMSPGSFDEKIRKVTLERFLKVLDIAAIFKPENIIFHTGYIDAIQGWFFDMWIDESYKTWKIIIDYCKKLHQKISIENVFEKNTVVHERLLKKIKSKLIGVCFDVGHHNVFGEIELEKWFKKFRDKIFEVHIHDNDGTFDWHKAVGEGNIDFYKIFKLIKKYCPEALLTLEAHDKDTMLKTYENVIKILEKI